jgi:hypothetical protein
MFTMLINIFEGALPALTHACALRALFDNSLANKELEDRMDRRAQLTSAGAGAV